MFAFYPNKQMTTGEGGMVTTDDAELAALLRSLANQGRSDSGDWLEHDKLGFNYRMDELSAAVGLAQTERLEEILAARAAVAARYDDAARAASTASRSPRRPRPATCARGSSTSCGSTRRSIAMP